MPQELGATHSATKHLRARPSRAEAASFAIIVAPAVWVSRALLGLCVIIP
jgi:hypothetical protein